MCWSYEVSFAFSTVEAVLILFLLIRSRLSSDPFIRKQWLLLPALLGICIMEAIEAYIWSRPDELMSVQDTYNDIEHNDLSTITNAATTATTTSCEKWNKRLTLFVWLFILPLQPLWVILPCRRVGHVDNWHLLKVPEFLAIGFAIGNLLVYLISSLTPLLESVALRPALSDTSFTSYLHEETCTFIGKSGHHLHWAYGTADTFLTPNAFTYFLLWSSVLFAKTKRFAAGIFLFAESLFFAQLLYFRMSWEAGSVWCWSAIFLFLYFVFQPYVFPCCDDQVKSTDCLSRAPLLSNEPLLVSEDDLN